MKIKYVGKKQKMSVTLPVGFGKSGQTGVLHFAPGSVHDFPEDEGAKFLELNAKTKNYVLVKEEAPKLAEAPKVIGKAHDKPKVG